MAGQREVKADKNVTKRDVKADAQSTDCVPSRVTLIKVWTILVG